MPEEEEKTGGEKEQSEKKATENVLMQKFGPFPAIVWVAIGAGFIGALLYLRSRGSSKSAKETTQAVPVGVPSSSAAPDTSSTPSSPDLTGTVTDLQSQIKGLSETVATQNAAIQQNETSLGTGIQSLQTSVGQAQSSVASLGSQVNSLSGTETEVTSLKHTFENLSQNVNLEHESPTTSNAFGALGESIHR